ncbi:MAG: hypothetical protein A3A51_02615 [Candidatus Levybacteria bacterium RIFCSPLOWO2_01_FULL_39_10]|nr:MAG: hypothetical protein A3A51_02615 [Candidatus Levybacteria bacterium RIFCSPLOWO2_01_FULL_39_10]
MGSNLLPKTRLGRWSIALNVFFLIVITTSIILVNMLGILSFNDRWWDVVVLVFLANIAAFAFSIIAIRKHSESSPFVYLSVIIGIITILFLLFHSLFISD